MRRWMALLGVVLCGSVCYADHIPAGLQWPGWRVETGEEIMGTRYPLTHLFDGNPATAWVFNKASEHRDEQRQPSLAQEFRHGVKQSLRISLMDGRKIVLDRIGITNGYSKSTSTYWRNNRILRLHVRLLSRTGAWGKSFTLRDTRQLQFLTIPRQQLEAIELSIEAVNAGRDDDLCISELVLSDRGTPLRWRVTPAVIMNGSNYDCGCGGGPDYTCRSREGRPLFKTPFLAIAGQPRTTRILLCTEHEFYYYDLASRRTRYHRRWRGSLGSWGVGWTDAHTALLAVDPSFDDWQHRRWYRFTTGRHYRFTRARGLSPQSAPAFLPGVQGPNYPA